MQRLCPLLGKLVCKTNKRNLLGIFLCIGFKGNPFQAFHFGLAFLKVRVVDFHWKVGQTSLVRLKTLAIPGASTYRHLPRYQGCQKLGLFTLTCHQLYICEPLITICLNHWVLLLRVKDSVKLLLTSKDLCTTITERGKFREHVKKEGTLTTTVIIRSNALPLSWREAEVSPV